VWSSEICSTVDVSILFSWKIARSKDKFKGLERIGLREKGRKEIMLCIGKGRKEGKGTNL
jgi:hypothetical protein